MLYSIHSTLHLCHQGCWHLIIVLVAERLSRALLKIRRVYLITRRTTNQQHQQYPPSLPNDSTSHLLNSNLSQGASTALHNVVAFFIWWFTSICMCEIAGDEMAEHWWYEWSWGPQLRCAGSWRWSWHCPSSAREQLATVKMAKRPLISSDLQNTGVDTQGDCAAASQVYLHSQ